MSMGTSGLFIAYEDIWLLDGVRTPFVDYCGALGLVSPIDLGIKVARALFERTKIAPPDVGSVTAGSVARSEEHTSELQSQSNLVCRLLLEKKKNENLPYTVLVAPA